jgi:hypothetical protein
MAAYPIYRYFNGEYANQMPTIAYIGYTFFLFFFAFSVLSLGGFYKMNYSTLENTIVLYSILGKKHISVHSIQGYYLSTLKTKWKDYPGYILQLADGTSVELTEYNLKPLRDFYSFLVRSEVPCKGTKNSWYPLKRSNL